MTIAQMRFRAKWGFGEHYEWIEFGHDGTPLRAWPLYPQFTKIQFSKKGYIESYNYGRDQSDPVRYKPDEVIFYKHRPSMSNPIRGESPLAANLPQADILFKNMMHDIAFVNGGNRPDSLVTVKDPNITNQQIKEIEHRIRDIATGGIASVKAFVTRDIDWKPLSWAPKDLNTAEKLDRYERHIRNAYGHTESMADSTESNVASAVIGFNAQFMGKTIYPALVNDASELSEFLIPLFGYEHGEYFFAYDNPVVADTDKESQTSIAEQNAGRITINESRKRAGLPPSTMPEANDLRVNGVKLGVLDAGVQADPTNPLAALFGTPAATSPTPDPKPSETPKAPDPNEVGDKPASQSDAETEAAQKKSHDTARLHITEIMEQVKIDHETPPCGCFTKGTELTGDTALDSIMLDKFPSLLAQLQSTLKSMQDEVIGSIARGGEPNLASQTQTLADILADHMDPIVEEMAKSTVAQLVKAGRLDSAESESFVPTEAIKSYRDHVSLVANDIAQFTEDIIKPAVHAGLRQGLSTNEVADAITKADIPKWRAERIARTEVSEAANGSRYDTMGQVGIEQVKVVTAPSPSAAHAIIAARSPLPIGSNFVEAGERIGREQFKTAKKRPPFRPNCRCRIEPVL